MTVTSYWSIVPTFLKPDALEGDKSAVAGQLAADFAGYLSAGLDESGRNSYEPHFPGSEIGADLARKHVEGEANAFSWYAWPPRNVPECRRRLAALHAEWSGLVTLDIPRLAVQASAALGFVDTHAYDHTLSMSDYMMFYGDTPRPDLHPRMQKYLVNKRVRLLLLCGQQENSALQAMKVYMRRVMLHPTGKSNGGNWMHVTNPDARNYAEQIGMFTSPYSGSCTTDSVQAQSTVSTEELGAVL
jgi:hypothetical protein